MRFIRAKATVVESCMCAARNSIIFNLVPIRAYKFHKHHLTVSITIKIYCTRKEYFLNPLFLDIV